MAPLISTVNTPYGMELKEAYIRISFLSGNENVIIITVNFYVSKAAYDEGKEEFQKTDYRFEPDIRDNAANFFKQGYEYLKSLPEFEGAYDVAYD